MAANKKRLAGVVSDEARVTVSLLHELEPGEAR